MEAKTKSAKAKSSGRAAALTFGMTGGALTAGWAANYLGGIVFRLTILAVQFVPSLISLAAHGRSAHGLLHPEVVEYFPQFVSCLSSALTLLGTL